MSKDPKESQTDENGRILPIRYKPGKQPGVFAQDVVFQSDGESFFLNFFQFSPPMVVGTEAQRDEILREMEAFEPKPVVQVIMPAKQAHRMLAALQEHIKRTNSRDNNEGIGS